jgi:hypothetical protein
VRNGIAREFPLALMNDVARDLCLRPRDFFSKHVSEYGDEHPAIDVARAA